MTFRKWDSYAGSRFQLIRDIKEHLHVAIPTTSALETMASWYGLCEAGRSVRPQRGDVRERDPVLQYHHLDGPPHAQHPALLCAVRARSDRRAHPGQVRGVSEEGHVDGWLGAARLWTSGIPVIATVAIGGTADEICSG